MKKQYIKQVKKELHLPRKNKAEVLRDLEEIFDSACMHGETEQQVIARLGTPKSFADSTAEQFGVDNTASQKRKDFLLSVIAIFSAVVSFVLYAAATIGKAPKEAIGQADAATNIRVESAFGFDFLQIILTVGAAAAAFAVIRIIRTVWKNRRQP